MNAKMYALEKKIKQRIYGNRIVFFAPLYLSNYCINSCVYCPYHVKNKNICRKKLTQDEVKAEIPAEVVYTQEMRQDGYDRKTTTDDHGMHVYGLAQDQNGTKYFMVKNSWGEAGKYKGIWYASDAFVRYKTMNVVVHKDALPKDIKKKLGLK